MVLLLSVTYPMSLFTKSAFNSLVSHLVLNEFISLKEHSYSVAMNQREQEPYNSKIFLNPQKYQAKSMELTPVLEKHIE